jgi:hypothetical protein
MLRKIDSLFRTVCGQFLVGMPLFFITISPYANKNDKDKQKAEKSFEQVTRAAQGLMQGSLDDDEFMPESDNTESALYDLYLTKATVDVPFIENAPNKEFMAIMPTAETPDQSTVTYQDLLDAYLEKVEYMIDVEKDYFNALIELDKVMVIAPNHQKAQYLRTKLKQRLKDELDKVKQKRSTNMNHGAEEIIDLKEQALLEAEKKLLAESLVPEKPFQAMVAAEKIVEPGDTVKPTAAENRSVIEPVRMMPEHKPEEKAVARQTPSSTKPHRDVVVVKNADLIKIKAQPKTVAAETAQGTDIVEQANVASFTHVGTAENIGQENSMQGNDQRTVERETAEGLKSDQVIGNEIAAKELARKTVLLEDRAEQYLQRGKQSFREGNLALALISFSKAKHCDVKDQHVVEIEQLIKMTRERLEALATEG